MRRARSLFQRSPFMGADGFYFGVTPITLAVYSWQIPREKLKAALKSKVPPGHVGTFPFVVKCLDGEWNISANWMVQFFPLGRSPEPPFQL